MTRAELIAFAGKDGTVWTVTELPNRWLRFESGRFVLFGRYTP